MINKRFDELTITEIAELVYLNNCIKGFNSEPDYEKWVATQMCNLHGEVTELWDSHRDGSHNMPCDKEEKLVALGFPAGSLSKEEEEIADIMIRALGYARHRGINIARAMFVKHSYNVTRPFKHGKKN